jgi:hypothetical protein
MTATERHQGSGWRTDVDAAFRGSATYRSLGEQQLSPAEERFERGRRTVGLFLAPAVTLVFALLPLDLPRQQQLLAAVLLGVIVLWITEPVPIPIGGLIGVGAIVVLGVVPTVGDRVKRGIVAVLGARCAGSSPSTGRTPPRSTGAPSCCSAPGSSSARCWPTPAWPRPSATARPACSG